MSEKHWPVPGSRGTKVPLEGRGSFWEDRGDRRHCGVDLYAPHGSDVYAVEDGRVLDTGIMTSPDVMPYWNITYYAFIRHGTLVARYGELHDVTVAPGDETRGGDVIGHVGTVLNSRAVTDEAPAYIQQLSARDAVSMLHFELYRTVPEENAAYLGGNWFGDYQPGSLVDPTEYLKQAAHDI